MNFLNNFSGQAHWALRIAIGSVFIVHGLTKFPALEGMSQMMGLPVAVIALLAAVEALGGLLVILGGFFQDWMTRLGALMLIPTMIGAISMVHWGQWSFAPSDTHPMGGMQFQVVLILIMLYLVIKGNSINTSQNTTTAS